MSGWGGTLAEICQWVILGLLISQVFGKGKRS